jgi:diacylglycerol O-acyltransferase
MRALTGIDSLFVSLESRTNLFHVGAVSVLDPSTAPPDAPPPYEALRMVVENRIERIPPFQKRLVEVPAGLDHPRWVQQQPDLSRHLRRGALPAPGAERELAQYAADVLARPLDRSRPLWEIHVVEGLEGGLVAGVAKLHHSIVDGVSGTEVTAALMDLEPVAPSAERPGEIATEAVPGRLSLLRDAVFNSGRRVVPAARLVGRLVSTAAIVRNRNRLAEVSAPPGMFDGPRTPLSAQIGTERVVGLARVDRADVDAVRQATHVKVNDVVLALTASALRLYLDERGELPSEPLAGFVPVSVRAGADGDGLDTGVNRLSGMLVSLATDVADPLTRLMVVAESSRSAKEQHRVLGETLFSDMASMAVPALLGPGSRLYRSLGLSSRFPPFNVVVSSFPGPDFPLYCAGAEMVAYHPFGPVIDGACVNVTAMSYRDQIGFGLLGCRDAVPDIEVLAHYIPEAMTELTKAVSAAGHRTSSPPARPLRAV